MHFYQTWRVLKKRVDCSVTQWNPHTQKRRDFIVQVLKLLFSRTMSVQSVDSGLSEGRHSGATAALLQKGHMNHCVSGSWPQVPCWLQLQGFVRMFIGHVARLSQNEAFRIGLICRLITQSADNSDRTIGGGSTEARHKRRSTDWKMNGELRLQRRLSQACSQPFLIWSFCITSTVYCHIWFQYPSTAKKTVGANWIYFRNNGLTTHKLLKRSISKI